MHTNTFASLSTRLALVFFLIFGTWEIQPPETARAAGQIVTNSNDNGSGSLRQTIADAVPGETISFDPSLAGQTITLASDLIINKDLTIDGSGLSPQLTVSGGNAAHLVMTNFPVVAISDFTIADGFTAGNGGAITSNGNLTLVNMTLRNNRALGDGGAIFASRLTMKNTSVYQNQAVDGGALAVAGGSHIIVNSTITGNQASHNGGSLFSQGNADVSIFNSTIAANHASLGTEFWLMGVSSMVLYNSIIACIPGDAGSCIIQSGIGHVFNRNSMIGTGTLESFGLSELADHGGPTLTMALLPGSPLLDAGDENVCANDLVNSNDQRGVFRPQGEGCDIGAYEKDVPTYRVAPDGLSDPACGASWSNPCNLQYALTNLATAESELWVQGGVHLPGTTRDATFQLVDGVELYGGFAGTESIRRQRDPASYITILSGDLLGNDNDNVALDEPTRADNAFHVVSGSELSSDTLLDSFTITGGNANGVALQTRGGGMYNDRGDPRLIHVIFRENTAVFGGGMFNVGDPASQTGSNPILMNVSFVNNSAAEGGGMENMDLSSPILTDVIFSGNAAIRSGGGMLNVNQSSPTLTNVVFNENTASAGGGLMNWLGNSSALTNVTFSSNAASELGGGLANDQSSPTLTNVTFAGNSSLQNGGGMHNENASPVLSHVTFRGNQAGHGGGVYNGSGSQPRIANSILYGDLGGEVHSVSGQPVITYSIVQGGYPGIGNLNADPLLGPLQNHGGFTDSMALGAGSPAIDAGDAEACAAADQRGVRRPQGVGCDMGSFEYYEGPLFAGETIRVSVTSAGIQANGNDASISANGRYVAFVSSATNLVPNDTNQTDDIFVHDIQTGVTKCVSVDSNGVLAASSGGTWYPSISADGRFVAFYSNASNLVPGDTGAGDIFVHDTQTGTTTRVSVSSAGTQANGTSILPSISADGRYIAFYSDATNLVADDTNAKSDVFLHDMQTSTTRRVSVSSSGAQANGGSSAPSVSADGRYITFASEASNLVTGDSNGKQDIFVHDLQTGTTSLVSVSSNGSQGNGFSREPSISEDGRYIAFQSSSSNLIPDDTSTGYDVFIRDVQNSMTTLVSMNSDEVQGNGESEQPSISADGRYVAFVSSSTNLVPDDTNSGNDIFVRDLQQGTTTGVSLSSGGTQGNGYASQASVSADGQYIAFTSSSDNLVSGDTNNQSDVFVHRQNVNPIPPPATSSDIDVYIAGNNIDTATVPLHGAQRVSYAGINHGPVQMLNTNHDLIMAAQRVIYRVNQVSTSFSEMMALPASQLDTTYWLPWYNNKDLNTQLRFANVSDSSATIRVFIGGLEVIGSPYTLAPGASIRRSYPNIDSGPVRIESNVPIVAAERVIYRVNNVDTSFSEMMAMPASQLDTIYWLPWYNNKDLNTQLRFANVSDQEATVHVSIGGIEVDGSPFTLAPGASVRKSFPGVDQGPVRIESNVEIVAAERVIYRVNNLDTSFSEMMALPNKQLDKLYWLPWYNNQDLDTQLRFANVSNTEASVHVFIGGVEVDGSPFTLAPGASIRRSFANLDRGPVKIESNVDIVAAERVIYKVNNIPTSFSEMMGLPDHLLDVTYWLPWYNNIELDTQLRFGLP